MTAKPRILITRRWPQAVERVLAERFDTVLNEEDRPLDRSALADALRNFDAVLPTVSDRLPADVFTGGGLRARILGNFGVGYNHIDAGAAKDAGIVVTNTPGVLTDCTADLAVSLLLAAARRTGEGERQVRAGAWEGWRPTHMLARMEETIGTVAARAARASLDDLGAATIIADIASLRHETLHSRLFRT